MTCPSSESFVSAPQQCLRKQQSWLAKKVISLKQGCLPGVAQPLSWKCLWTSIAATEHFGLSILLRVSASTSNELLLSQYLAIPFLLIWMTRIFSCFSLGLPETVAQDNGGGLHVGSKGGFQVDEEKFIANMKKVNAWDSRLVVTKGWFKDTAPGSPVKKISFLRLDGDLYSSTYDAISAFYDRVVHGGFIYVDDYGSFNGCREAIDEFRLQRRIFEPLHLVREHNGYFEAVWWRKLG